MKFLKNELLFRTGMVISFLLSNSFYSFKYSAFFCFKTSSGTVPLIEPTDKNMFNFNYNLHELTTYKEMSCVHDNHI